MADGAGGGEKTEKPTPQKLKKARKDGQIPRSAELGTWLGMGAASMLLPRVAGEGMEASRALLLQIRTVANNPEQANMAILLAESLKSFMVVILPLGLAMLVVGVMASAVQGGVRWASKPIKPSWKKFNLLQAFKRMFGTQGLWEATKAIIKTAVLGVALWTTVDTARDLTMHAGALPLSSVTETVGQAALRMFRIAAITGLAIALADYAVVRWKLMKQLKMSKYEIQQEFKQAEGDPMLKARRRNIALQMSGNRMMAAAIEADVLLVNPTHVAVALKYDAARGAPRVVAKGAGEVAAKLRALAEEHRVPMVQDVPLARALFSACDLDQEIPGQLFTAVARVLAFVMQLKKRGVAAGIHRPGFPAPDTVGLAKAGRRR